MAMPITLPHPIEDLRGKRLKFRFLSSCGDPVENGIASGEGVLAIDGPDDVGLYDAFIHAESFDGIPGGPGTWTFTDIYLDQRAADCLKVLEDGTLTCLDATL